MEFDLCSASIWPLLRCWRDWDGGLSAVWHRPLSPFWASSQRGRSKKKMRGAKRTMVSTFSTISFIQTNLQHSIAASGILTRTVGVKGIDMALVQELWYREHCIKGLNLPGYTLHSAGGKDRPSACILARNMNIWMLPGFSCRDLVAILVKYNENGAEKQLVILI